MKREHISPLRWLAAALLFLVATLVFATVVVYAGEKLGALGGLVVTVALAWPYSWLITLPIREKEAGVSRSERIRRLRFWGLVDLVYVLGGAILIVSALVGREVGGDWGVLVGVGVGCGVLLAANAAWRRRFPRRDQTT